MSRQKTSEFARCATCWRTFADAVGFDLHRDHGHCLDPAALDMVAYHGKWIMILCNPEEGQTQPSKPHRAAAASRTSAAGTWSQQTLFKTA